MSNPDETPIISDHAALLDLNGDGKINQSDIPKQTPLTQDEKKNIFTVRQFASDPVARQGLDPSLPSGDGLFTQDGLSVVPNSNLTGAVESQSNTVGNNIENSFNIPSLFPVRMANEDGQARLSNFNKRSKLNKFISSGIRGRRVRLAPRPIEPLNKQPFKNNVSNIRKANQGFFEDANVFADRSVVPSQIVAP